jgi:hypothetical protein
VAPSHYLIYLQKILGVVANRPSERKAYSMRYYGSEYPENFESEARDIDMHVLGLCAPTKNLHY